MGGFPLDPPKSQEDTVASAAQIGNGQTEATLPLAPGRHTLQLLLGDGNHIPHPPAVASRWRYAASREGSGHGDACRAWRSGAHGSRIHAPSK
ncbi:MAG: DUF4399 domain-containing protein [Pseudomonadota bacterium]